jgi:predicted lipoprotein with Yx(FWY)xxD motif
VRTRFTRSVLPLAALGTVSVVVAVAASAASTVTIKASSALGTKILVNSSGFTLYHYTDETKGSIHCTGACAKVWRPLLMSGSAKPVAGSGLVATKLGTVKRPDGGMQVTYNGLALYRYSADTKAGQTNGQGVEGAWYAVTSKGVITKAKVSTAATAVATSSSSTSSGSTSSGGSAGAGGTPATPANCTPGVIVMDANNPCYNY